MKFLLMLIVSASSVSNAAFTVRTADDIGKMASSGQSIEQVLHALPKEMRLNYVLMRDSRSLQKATSAQPLFPRGIFFDDTANLIVSFIDYSVEGSNRLEVLDFNEATQAYQFREFTFGQLAAGEKHDSGINPAKCVRCHTQALIPNWRQYNDWEGAFGRFNNVLMGTEKVAEVQENSSRTVVRTAAVNQELIDLKKFLASKDAHPRYSALLSPPNEPLWPFAKDAADPNGPEPSAEYAPNRRFGILLNFRQSLAYAHRISKSEAYQKFPGTILYTLAGCYTGNNFELDSYFAEHIYKTLNPSARNPYQTVNAMTVRDSILNLFSFIGIQSAEWNMDHFTRSGGLPFFMGFYEMGTSPVATVVKLISQRKDLWDGEMDTSESMAEAMGMNRSLLTKLAKLIPPVRQVKIQQYYCPKLKAKMESEKEVFSQFVASLQTASSIDDMNYPAVLHNCVSCHVRNEDGSSPPFIPFTNELRLRESLASGGYKRGNLFDEIVFRLGPNAGAAQMPPDSNNHFRPLVVQKHAQEEKAQILEYLRGLHSR